MFSVRRLSMIAMIAALAASGSAHAASINLGGNGGLLGGGNGGGLLGGGSGGSGSGLVGNNGGVLGTGLLGGNGGSSGGSTAGSASVNLGGLFGGDGSDNTAANVTLGSGGLLGGDGSTTGSVTVGQGNGSVLVDLFGNGGNTGDAGLTLGLAGDQGGVAPNGDVTLDLFGDGTDNGGGGSGGGVPPTPGPTTEGLFGPGATSTVETTASLNPSLAKTCFTPNPRQVMQLVNRHPYGPNTFQSWAGASTVKVIDAGVCDQAAARIDAQANIGRLQQYITSNDQLRTQLAQWGHAPTDVIAVDRQGKTLLVYVS